MDILFGAEYKGGEGIEEGGGLRVTEKELWNGMEWKQHLL